MTDISEYETGHWWCPHCKIIPFPTEVTFQEVHEPCGHYVEWIHYTPSKLKDGVPEKINFPFFLPLENDFNKLLYEVRKRQNESSWKEFCTQTGIPQIDDEPILDQLKFIEFQLSNGLKTGSTELLFDALEVLKSVIIRVEHDYQYT